MSARRTGPIGSGADQPGGQRSGGQRSGGGESGRDQSGLRRSGGHEPVLLSEVTGFLARPGSLFLDLTLGAGGHARALLEASGREARLLGLDRDRRALEVASARLASFGERVTLVQSRASQAGALLSEGGWLGALDAVLADLGLSSMQLDDAQRGFSFDSDAPLDMRMDQSEGPRAGDLLDRWTAGELKEVLSRYGEQPRAGFLAKAILEARREGSLETCRDLARLVAERLGPGKGRLHPATRVFQALRIAVNRELDELEAILAEAPFWLAPGGRLAVISFHSLEDRMVKQRFAALSRPSAAVPADLPLRDEDLPKPEFSLLTARPVRPSPEETARNPRARSARLRVIERRGREE